MFGLDPDILKKEMHMLRPDFSTIKSYEEFSQYYWYREELQKICRELGIDASGMKAELNHNIEEYFKGNLIKSGKIDLYIDLNVSDFIRDSLI